MNAIYKFLLFSFSRLPLGVLYCISDILTFLNTHIIKYRTNVVRENLENSFPNKSTAEINLISQNFFRNFFDFIIESLKGITISQEEIDTRISLEGLEIVEKYAAANQNIMVLCGHLFNWEWVKGLVKQIPQSSVIAVYSVPKSQLINDIISKSREKFGGEVISMGDARKIIAKTQNDSTLYLMVADQSPYKKAIRYDIQFLNQTTPVFQGFDKIARKHDMGVVYLDIIRQGRGKFLYKFIDILPEHEKFAENEIVHKFFEHLEQSIHRQPDNYMWTHRRWKYKKGIDY